MFHLRFWYLYSNEIINNNRLTSVFAFTCLMSLSRSLPSSKQTECRICCDLGDSNVDGPLLTPCHCSGSMKYIHLQCLVKCIETRNSDHCEVCLGKFTQIETCTYRPSFAFQRTQPRLFCGTADSSRRLHHFLHLLHALLLFWMAWR